MNSRYTLIISNKNFYKEVEIPRNQKKITIGTNNDCVARLRKDYFFEAVNILLVNEGKNWQVICKDNLYIADGVSKLYDGASQLADGAGQLPDAGAHQDRVAQLHLWYYLALKAEAEFARMLGKEADAAEDAPAEE